MGTIIVCCAHKGGVGKTVTVHNLYYALSRMGKRVLAVDFDDQANLTTCFGIDAPEQLPITIADLMDMQIHDENVPDKSQYGRIWQRQSCDTFVSEKLTHKVEGSSRPKLWRTDIPMSEMRE